MENYHSLVRDKINELSSYGYTNNFSFENGRLFIEQQVNEQKVVHTYVPEQVSVEAEYLYEESGSAVITFMTNDGILGFAVDRMDDTGEFPLINYFESIEED